MDLNLNFEVLPLLPPESNLEKALRLAMLFPTQARLLADKYARDASSSLHERMSALALVNAIDGRLCRTNAQLYAEASRIHLTILKARLPLRL